MAAPGIDPVDRPSSIKDCTQFQLFVLSYLYGRDLESHTRHSMRLEDIATLVPAEILPENETRMRREIKGLIASDLLQPSYIVRLTPEKEDRFSLGPINGVIFVRKYLSTLVPKVYDRHNEGLIDKTQGKVKINETILDKTQGKAEVKNYFRDLLNKLKEKSQDEIVDGLISGAKQYGPLAIMFLIKMAQLHAQ